MDPTDTRGIADRVKLTRQQRGWTQRLLDHRAGFATGYTSKLENYGIPNPGVLQLLRIARALEVPLNQLIQGAEGAEDVTGAVLPLPLLSNPQLEDVTAHLLAIQEIDPHRLEALRVIIIDVRKQAELQGRRVKTRRIRSKRP